MGELVHTKGPWSFTNGEWNDGPFENNPNAKNSTGSIVAYDEDGTRWFIARVDNANEHEANARLIAAAPELYERIEFLCDQCDSENFDYADLQTACLQARLLLARIRTGESA